jgi:O-antigen/teichoic acid export membrane protein
MEVPAAGVVVRADRSGAMKILRSAAINLLSVVVVALAGLASTWVMTRYLPVEQFGRVALVLAIVNAVGVLEGLRPVVILHAHSGEVSWHALYGDARRIALATGALVFAATLLGGLVIERFGLSVWESLIVACTMMLFFSVALYWAFLDADGEVAFTGAWRGALWVATYGAFAGLAWFGAPFAGYLLVLLAMNATLTMIYYVRLSRRRDLRGARPSGRGVAWLYRLAFENVRLNLSAVTIGVSDRLAIGATLGSSQAALYSAPYEFATKPVALVRSLAHVLYPGAVRLSKQIESIDGHWLRISAPIVLLSIAGCALVICFRDGFVTLLLGPKYVESADVFGILALSFWMVTFGYAANVYLNSHGDFVTQRRFYDWGAGAMLLGVLPAIHFGGIEGVACLYALVRCVDLALGILVWRRVAAGRGHAHAISVGAAVAVTFVAAWLQLTVVTLSALGASCILALRFMYRGA